MKILFLTLTLFTTNFALASIDTPHFISHPSNIAPTIDIDGNSEFDSLTDGLIILRSLFGLTGDPLTSNVIGESAIYTSAEDINAQIVQLGEQLDIDGNSDIGPLSDGLLIMRYLFGFRGSDLIHGVVAFNGQRSTGSEIETYLAKLSSYMPTMTSSPSFDTSENQLSIGQITVHDSDGDTIEYAISEADSNIFSIDDSSGVLSFIEEPDISNIRNYTPTVHISDGIHSISQLLGINIIPENCNNNDCVVEPLINSQGCGYNLAVRDSGANLIILNEPNSAWNFLIMNYPGIDSACVNYYSTLNLFIDDMNTTPLFTPTPENLKQQIGFELFQSGCAISQNDVNLEEFFSAMENIYQEREVGIWQSDYYTSLNRGVDDVLVSCLVNYQKEIE